MHRSSFGLLALLILVACGGPDRSQTNPPVTTPDSGIAQNDSGTQVAPDAGNPMGEVCMSLDGVQTCRCEPGSTCGSSANSCVCIPGMTPDAGFTDAGTPRDGGTPPPRDGGTPPRDGGTPPGPDGGLPPIPTYQGQCPTFVHGTNSIMSGGTTRQFDLALPQFPMGRPAMFTWHWWMGHPDEALSWTGILNTAFMENLIAVSPHTHPNAGNQWYNSGPPNSNPDVQLFDDILACLYQQFTVDLDRIWATGHSMGGLFISYLIQHRAQYLAAFVPWSGGQTGSYTTPSNPIPGMLVWGGPTDLYGSFNFEQATLTLSNNLRNDGSFIMHCIGDFGHQLPPMDPSGQAWPFLRDHARGMVSPYIGGLPANTFSSDCSIP